MAFYYFFLFDFSCNNENTAKQLYFSAFNGNFAKMFLLHTNLSIFFCFILAFSAHSIAFESTYLTNFLLAFVSLRNLSKHDFFFYKKSRYNLSVLSKVPHIQWSMYKYLFNFVIYFYRRRIFYYIFWPFPEAFRIFQSIFFKLLLRFFLFILKKCKYLPSLNRNSFFWGKVRKAVKNTKRSLKCSSNLFLWEEQSLYFIDAQRSLIKWNRLYNHKKWRKNLKKMLRLHGKLGSKIIRIHT